MFLPQIVLTMRTKHTKELSAPMLMLRYVLPWGCASAGRAPHLDNRPRPHASRDLPLTLLVAVPVTLVQWRGRFMFHAVRAFRASVLRQ